jgi:hypothetical protein
MATALRSRIIEMRDHEFSDNETRSGVEANVVPKLNSGKDKQTQITDVFKTPTRNQKLVVTPVVQIAGGSSRIRSATIDYIDVSATAKHDGTRWTSSWVGCFSPFFLV